MLKVKINDINYRYDIFQIITLFLNSEEFCYVEDDEDIFLNITKEALFIKKDDEIIFQYMFSIEFPIKENIKKAVLAYFTTIFGEKAPWGILVGIRPTKLALALINEGASNEEIYDYYEKHFNTKNDKIKLCIDIANNEIGFLNKDEKKISIYIGMPFCPSKCLYCSFTSNPIEKNKKLVLPYLKALNSEIEALGSHINSHGLKVESVYFGGGTPTSVNDEEFEYITSSIWSNLIKEKEVKEFTIECGRPDTINVAKLLTMKIFEVTRISINPQTMNDDTLKLIGRGHTARDTIEKYNLARNLGFTNINMDIIVGLTGEDHNHIERTCEEIYKLHPDSLTVHGMSIKRASKLHENLINHQRYNKITEEAEINRMYAQTIELATKIGMKPYYMYRQKNTFGNRENIGYSMPGKESIYNIEMIEDRQSIAALGADSVSKVIFFRDNKIERFSTVKDVNEYIKRIDEIVEKKLKFLSTII